MPRIRTIKPEFFLHTGLAELSPLHRLFFVGLWTQADKKGRLCDNSRKIKVTVLPYDDVDIEKLLQDLHDHPDKFIIRYEIQGHGKFIQINKFDKHQRPHHTEQDSVLPPFKNGLRTVKKRLLTSVGTSGEGKGLKDTGEGKGYSVEFLSFWELYKKKTDKLYAFTCYKRLLKDGILPDMIFNHLVEYDKKLTAEQTELQFIKNPSTFLNKTDFKETPTQPDADREKLKRDLKQAYQDKDTAQGFYDACDSDDKRKPELEQRLKGLAKKIEFLEKKLHKGAK